MCVGAISDNSHGATADQRCYPHMTGNALVKDRNNSCGERAAHASGMVVMWWWWWWWGDWQVLVPTAGCVTSVDQKE